MLEKQKQVKIPVFDFEKGKKIKGIKLPNFLDVKISPFLIRQALISQISKKIKPGHTKTRGEVRGGGRKPYRQKGTGRARHGSIRSPIFKGGGICFGPRETENKIKKISKNMCRKALAQALKNKIDTNSLILLDNIKMKQIKTKNAFNIIQQICPNKKTLIIFANTEKNIAKAFRNLATTKMLFLNNINLFDILDCQFVLFSLKAWQELEKIKNINE